LIIVVSKSIKCIIFTSSNNNKPTTMKTTMTFTTEHEAELNRIVTLNVFASKIATTILSKDFYKASPKQVDILNQVSDIEFYISDDYSNDIMERGQQRQRNLMYL